MPPLPLLMSLLQALSGSHVEQTLPLSHPFPGSLVSELSLLLPLLKCNLLLLTLFFPAFFSTMNTQFLYNYGSILILS
jgi:hypothetical protein